VCLSEEKFLSFYTHLRRCLGRQYNSRTLTVGMLPYKRDQLLSTLSAWLSRGTFDLMEVSSLLGQLDNHTRYARWARIWYCSLQNCVRRILTQRFHVLRRLRVPFALRGASLFWVLPRALLY